MFSFWKINFQQNDINGQDELVLTICYYAKKTFNSEFFPGYRSGSVAAEVELKFEKSVLDPLKPLEDEIKDGSLGSFTVSRELDLNPSKACAT